LGERLTGLGRQAVDRREFLKLVSLGAGAAALAACGGRQTW